jgi:hypothetical protein
MLVLVSQAQRLVGVGPGDMGAVYKIMALAGGPTIPSGPLPGFI